MKIKQLRIQNFRAIKNEKINFDDYVCLIGPNGSGKSTILNALNLFFRETASAATNLINLQEEDFHGKNTKEDIVITVSFDELNDSEKEALKDYYRAGELIVSS